MQDAREADGYVLARTEAEYQRLRLQAKAWEAGTRALLTDAGAAPGWRCLDVGCGPGEAMRLIGQLTRPGGHVTGVDIDAALGAHMLAELHRSEGPDFAFIAGDATRLDTVPGAPFDLVFARLLLVHLTDPVTMVRRLGALVRPGGRLVLMDYDLSRLAARPEHPALDRAFAIIAGAFGSSGKHADAGLRLGTWLVEAGLPPVRGTRADALYGPIARLGPMVRAVLASLAPALPALGLATAEEITALQVEITTLEASDRHMGLGPLMIGAWTVIP